MLPFKFKALTSSRSSASLQNENSFVSTNQHSQSLLATLHHTISIQAERIDELQKALQNSIKRSHAYEQEIIHLHQGRQQLEQICLNYEQAIQQMNYTRAVCQTRLRTVEDENATAIKEAIQCKGSKESLLKMLKKGMIRLQQSQRVLVEQMGMLQKDCQNMLRQVADSLPWFLHTIVENKKQACAIRSQYELAIEPDSQLEEELLLLREALDKLCKREGNRCEMQCIN